MFQSFSFIGTGPGVLYISTKVPTGLSDELGFPIYHSQDFSYQHIHSD